MNFGYPFTTLADWFHETILRFGIFEDYYNSIDNLWRNPNIETKNIETMISNIKNTTNPNEDESL